MEKPLPPDVDMLIDQLANPDPGEKIRTIRRLADLDCRDEKVRLALEQAARDDPDTYVRTEAKTSLAKLGFPVHLSEVSPFLTIWFKPRGTIRKIVDTDPTKYVLLLAMLSGIFEALDNASKRGAGDLLPLIAVLASCIIFGSIGGIISLYLGGALFRWSGSWFGGKATSEEVRAAIAWSSVPIVFITLPLLVLMLLIFGGEMFSSSTPRMDANPILALIISLPVLFASVIAWIWSLVLLAKCVGEVHRFSAWKALGAMILGILVIAIPLLLILVVIGFLS